jgi:hypothetical protein
MPLFYGLTRSSGLAAPKGYFQAFGFALDYD